MDPHAYCQDKAASSGSSFYYSFLFLPDERRRAITALYAFCREVDDVVDECTDAGVARMKLAWWRNEIASIHGGKPQHPVAVALAEVSQRFRIREPQLQLQEIISGMEMDLDFDRYRNFEELERYCYKVASVVGLLSAEIFGYKDERTLEYAENLGMAFQLTNIVRDVGEDARRGRIYLPQDEMARYGVSADDIIAARETPAFKELMEFQIDRALDYYRRAFDALPAADRRAQRPGLVMAAIYRSLIDEIRADGCRVLTRKVKLTPLRKLWIAWRTWVKG